MTLHFKASRKQILMMILSILLILPVPIFASDNIFFDVNPPSKETDMDLSPGDPNIGYMPDLYAGIDAICTTPNNGAARWYSVNKKDAGKTMTVTLPEGGAFGVYVGETCIYDSLTEGNHSVKLPENGRVVFIGAAPGDRFIITVVSAKYGGTVRDLHQILKEKWSEYRKGYEKIPGGVALMLSSKDGSFFTSYDMQDDMTEDTRFRAASITKTLTAASILLLEQNGLLNIDDTVNSAIPCRTDTYLPDDANYDIPYKNKITIRQLLEHRAGVFDINNSDIPAGSKALYAGKNYIEYVLEQDEEHDFSIDEIVRVVAKEKLFYSFPGTEYHYSDTGYSLLGKIIERVSGMGYNDFVTNNFLLPNHMFNSSLPHTGKDQKIPSPFVLGYDYYQGEYQAVENDNMSFQIANGNLTASMWDLAAWAKRLYTGNAGINSDYVQKMTDTKPISDTSGYGLGCHYIHNLGFGHTGAVRGYLSLMVYDPESEIAMVILANVLNWEDPAGELVLLRDIGLFTKRLWDESKPSPTGKNNPKNYSLIQ